MKKLLLLFLLFSKTALFSQTVLNSLPLNLNFLSKTQILNAEDEKTKDLYVFTWDDKNINILKYNQSLFLSNRFTDSIKHERSRNLIGYSISDDKKPALYWSSTDNRNILITIYNPVDRTSELLNFDFRENHDYIISSFQQLNVFYILAKEIRIVFFFTNLKMENVVLKRLIFPILHSKTRRMYKYLSVSLLNNFP
jgi:hypothetical protein